MVSALSTQHFLLEPLEPRVLLSAAPALVPEGLLPQAQIHIQDAQPSAQLPSLDVDLNGVAETATDGKLILRYMAGAPDSQLTADGAVGAGAHRTTGSDIRGYLDTLAATPGNPLDADGDGTLNPFTDGRLIFRYLGHVPDQQLLAGSVLGTGASRTDAPAITTFLATIDPAQDITPPVLTAGLQTDTGLSPSDAITSNATITGHLADVNLITGLTAGFDATPVGNFADMLADFNQLTGDLLLTPARLAQLAGGTLADGTHTPHLPTRHRCPRQPDGELLRRGLHAGPHDAHAHVGAGPHLGFRHDRRSADRGRPCHLGRANRPQCHRGVGITGPDHADHCNRHLPVPGCAAGRWGQSLYRPGDRPRG